MGEERFKQLYQLEQNLYADDAPVIIEKGSLLLDNQTHTVLIQMKFHSLSEKTIKALKIRIKTYYTSGVACPEIVEYEYLDMKVGYGGQFGSNKAILLKDLSIRSFSVESYSVVYEDQEVAEIKEPFNPLPVSKELQEEWVNRELQKQYRIETSEASEYVPIKYGKLWKCACGEWNSRELCSMCRKSKSTIFGKFDVDILTSALEVRLKKEAAEREEQKKREAEEAKKQEAVRLEEARKKAQMKKNRRIAVPVILVGIFAFGIYSDIIKPNLEYKHAKELLSEKKFDESINAFEALGEYKDSVDMITEAQCLKAKNLAKNKKYDEAREIFENLGKYALYKETTQQEAENLITEGKYADAIILVEDFDDKKSKELVLKAEYERGIWYMEQENYQTAMGYLKRAKDYKDAKSKVAECRYLLGIQYMDKGRYDIALKKFKYIFQYDDGEILKKAEEKIKECEEKLNQQSEVETEDIEEYAENFSYSGIEDGSVSGKIKITGKVLQAFDAENGSMYIRLGLNSNKDEVVLVTAEKDLLDNWLIDNKIITVYGATFNGKFNYESQGGKVTLPWIPADKIEVQEN